MAPVILRITVIILDILPEKYAIRDIIVSNMIACFYKKENKKITPVTDEETTLKAIGRKAELLEKKRDIIPKQFLENWDEVALYNPGGNVDKANALILNPDDGAYDLGNKINEMTGKDWTKFTCSWFIFNALASDLKQEKELDSHIEDHPATFSPTMISDFIKFFTKSGMSVLDPFCGIGSTMEACKRTGRIGYGIELNKKYYDLILKRTPEFKDNIVNGDSSDVLKFGFKDIDFCISSPPYWDILTRSTKDFEKNREKKQLDVKYSSDELDLGNISDYDAFMKKLAKIYLDIYEIMRPGAYIVIIIKNVKKSGVMYPIAWDLARMLSEKYVLKDEKIWIQDKVALSPYGYPFAWSSNILHHYCLILRKE